MPENNKFNQIMDIVKKAEEMDLLITDRVSLIMDLEVADEKFDLRLEDLLKADVFNFTHDIIGIQRNIDRENGKMNDNFIPRFSSLKQE